MLLYHEYTFIITNLFLVAEDKETTPNKEDIETSPHENDIGDASDLHDGEVGTADVDPEETSL